MRRKIVYLFDLLFFHCYYWARADEEGKKLMACHMMSFCLIMIFLSLVSIFSLIMPQKFVRGIAIVLGLGVFFMYEELHSRYDNRELRKAIIKKYKPPTFVKFLLVYIICMLVCSLPTILISIMIIRK